MALIHPILIVSRVYLDVGLVTPLLFAINVMQIEILLIIVVVILVTSRIRLIRIAILILL